jgi:energy-coupling factor transporter ATP-binding protein EcfA2
VNLEYINLRSFRTCHDVDLSNLGQLTVLIGRNGVGKTNILQGIQWLAQTASSSQDYSPPFEFLSLSAAEICAEAVFGIDGTKYKYLIEISPQTNDKGHIIFGEFIFEESLNIKRPNHDWRTLISRHGDQVYDENNSLLLKINKMAPMLPSVVALLPSSPEIIEKALDVIVFFRGIRYYPLDDSAFNTENPRFSGIVQDRVYREWLSKPVGSSAKKDDVIFKLLHLFLERKDDFDELAAILGRGGIGVISNITIQKIPLENAIESVELTDQKKQSDESSNKIFYFIGFKPGNGWDGASNIPSLNYEKLSYGTRRLICILVSFFYDKSSVFLFEQPEDAIHPGLLRQLVSLLRTYSDKGQIILSSHSSDLLNSINPDEVRLITMESGNTIAKPLSENELIGARNFLSNEGPLSEYLDLLQGD